MSTEHLNFTRQEFETILEATAERGAMKALQRVGLHDDGAMGDLRDLRGLLGAYRTVKNSLLTTIGKAIAVAVIAVLAFKFGINGRIP